MRRRSPEKASISVARASLSNEGLSVEKRCVQGLGLEDLAELLDAPLSYLEL